MSSRNFVNLNINPCKMCMPMGAVLAFKGIEKNMVILHGSQGCSTYIRRHMATHYNEPIDIASSALTENGTVYGGSSNLKSGLKNMIKLYNPTTIGVMTTCLAETIGEDIKRIINEFYEEEGLELKDKLKIIPVPTPGYGGTHEEGYYRALRAILENLCKPKKKEKNGKINIICGNLNPGDVRNIKEALNKFKISYTLLPDVSLNLDMPYINEYSRLNPGGTKISDIEDMGNAVATIEMGVTVDEALSPGVYLRNEFDIPLFRCGLPIGLRNTDIFLKLVSKVMLEDIPKELIEDRGRHLDYMIDNHKHNGEARAAIYGEAELALSLVKLCKENGIEPRIIATGAKNPIFIDLVREELKDISKEYILLDDTDFETIEKYSKELEVNVMLGNSDGRRIAEKLHIEIVRVGFPVHDRVGAQRKITTLYNGTSNLIDEIANVIMAHKEHSFRKDAYKSFYKGDEPMEMMLSSKEEIFIPSNNEKTLTHPCYNQGAHEYARMHIPVAPKCNITCNYCSRKYDCPNESRPGVTSEVLTPEEALEKFKAVKEKIGNLKVLGIAGPGDALANFEETKRSIELIKNQFPDVTICLSTNGLMLPFYANELLNLGVSHLTITINAVDPKIGGKIYKNVNFLGNSYTGEEAAEILLKNQLMGLRYLSSKGMICKVNTVMIKGINDNHIEEVVKKVKECGAFITNIMQLIPVKGSAFENLPLVSNIELNTMRKKCETHIKQMYHCKQCRADAIGTLSLDRSIEFRSLRGCSSGCGSGRETEKEQILIKSKEIPKSEELVEAEKIIKPETISDSKEALNIEETLNNEGLIRFHQAEAEQKYRFAIATKTGINIDQHFGHATEFHIYEYFKGDISFLEIRNTEKYCTGITDCDDHEDKIKKTIMTIEDCSAVLAMRAGDSPVKTLAEKGIEVFQMYDGINSGINKAIEAMGVL
ncbi:nitrogenase cofactor biosynthesis protein NifB [Clostridium zeae]|uniref:Nitrogenase cofactor biosynthesis protein NifB n=1 Tax=Clostridium zeae TaxID=2759022 RepID=A0ABQ1EIC2_9CLOT|nr:nitrogenase cofactor biosynthesis protein NifB [Clostridium zeae]GFZ34577.1 nitrogenase cofactor biosynthesis protein NifB [Clostridium zeae]